MRDSAGNVELGESSLSEGELQPQPRPSSSSPALFGVLGPLHWCKVNNQTFGRQNKTQVGDTGTGNGTLNYWQEIKAILSCNCGLICERRNTQGTQNPSELSQGLGVFWENSFSHHDPPSPKPWRAGSIPELILSSSVPYSG